MPNNHSRHDNILEKRLSLLQEPHPEVVAGEERMGNSVGLTFGDTVNVGKSILVIKRDK